MKIRTLRILLLQLICLGFSVFLVTRFFHLDLTYLSPYSIGLFVLFQTTCSIATLWKDASVGGTLLATGILLAALVSSTAPAFDSTHLLAFIGSGLVGYLGATIFSSLIESRRAVYLREQFSRYISPRFVEMIAENFDENMLKGDERDLTVLFLDIENFSTLSELLPAPDLVRELNLIFHRMNEILFEHGATIDKYTGDGLLAFWNAPIKQNMHEELGLRCSWDLLDSFSDYTVAMKGHDAFPIRIRIGLACGEAVVGNIGSARRFNYTIIGDTVNIAARLEQLNKEYDTRLLVNDRIVSKLKPRFDFKEVDCIQLKGRSEKTAVFSPIEHKG